MSAALTLVWSRPTNLPAPEGAYPSGMLEAVERTARGYGLRASDVFGRDRHRRFAAARHHAFAVVRWTLDLSYPELGALFGVDHSSIMSGIRAHEARVARRNP